MVDEAGVARKARLDAIASQRIGKERRFVDQRVEFRAMNQGRREAGEILSAEGRDAGIVRLKSRNTIEVPECGERALFDEKALGHRLTRRRAAKGVQNRAQQDLQIERRSVLAQGSRSADRERGADRVTRDPEPIGINCKTPGFGHYDPCGSAAILPRRGKPMFGRKPVGNGDDAASSFSRERRADRVMGFSSAGDPAATVKIDEGRKPARGRGR